MIKSIITIFYIVIGINCIKAQSLGRVGSSSDVAPACTGGTVLMGGGSDVDAAFSWMINKSGGGDFVVIRASGTDAYNSYIYGLGETNSVETFLINSAFLANDSSIVQAIRKAEAVFFAGGDQNDYITFYKGTALGSTLDYLANVKHVPFGGTSAGMAIQGYIYYDGVTNVLSNEVLMNPYRSGNGLHYNDFLHNPFLKNTICDTHFNTKGGTTPNGIKGRQGRLMTFLARMITDSSLTEVKGIACDEKTAVCIDQNGIAMVVGINNAYFLRQWCDIPEVCISGKPLTWTNGARVYVIDGPGNYESLPSPAKSIDLNNWNTVLGGSYEYWTVNSGELSIGQATGTPSNCNSSGLTDLNVVANIKVYPNPCTKTIQIEVNEFTKNIDFRIINSLGTEIQQGQLKSNLTKINIPESGLYFIILSDKKFRASKKIINF